MQPRIPLNSARQWQLATAKWPLHHHGATHPIQWVGNNRLDPLQPPACKPRRAQEAKAAVGGLRDPALPLDKLPDLDTYGYILNLALAKVLDRDPDAEATLLSVLQVECKGFSEDTIFRARQCLCKLVGIPCTADMGEAYTPQAKLLRALARASWGP